MSHVPVPARPPKKGKFTVFMKALTLCVVLLVLCMAGLLIVWSLKPPPPWAHDAKTALMIASQMLLLLGLLLKFAVQLFGPRK